MGYVRIDGDRVTHLSGRLLEATLTLVRQGVPLAEILDAADFVQTQAAALADRFVGLFRRHVIGPDGLERLSAGQLDHVSEAVFALRPVAGEVVASEFARAMERRVARRSPNSCARSSDRPVGVGRNGTLRQPCQPPLALLHSTRR